MEQIIATLVIPGRCAASNPESRDDNLRIPGLRLAAHPGMTMQGREAHRGGAIGGFREGLNPPCEAPRADLILRSLATRSGAGRLEGWRLARPSLRAILLKAMQSIVRRRIAGAMLLRTRSEMSRTSETH